MSFYYLADDMILNLDHVEYICAADKRLYFHLFDERDFFRTFTSEEEAREELHEIFIKFEEE